MRDITAKLKEAERKRLNIQLGNYEKALGNTTDEAIKASLKSLIASTKQSIKNLK